MPQKKNPDVLEIARAKSEQVSSHSHSVRSIIGKLPHGYNRDSQQTKKHLLEALENVSSTLEILAELVDELEVSENFELKEEIYAADTANKLVEEDLSFREAYREIKQKRTYTGEGKIKPPVNQNYDQHKNFWQEEKRQFQQVRDSLLPD